MPIDHKRIRGPEESVPYELFSRTYSKNSEQDFNQICKEKNRLDNRLLQDQREIFLKTGVVSQAKGSSYIEIGQTKLIVAVFDPREIPNKSDYSLKGEIYCEFKFAPFSCSKRRLHQQDNEEKQYSCIMKKALESAVCLHELPNFQVDIYTLVLHNDGSVLSAAIMAAGLALAQAGVPMYDIITSATLAVQQNVVFVDPSYSEENICRVQLTSDDCQNPNHGIVIISKLHTQQQICQFYHSGYISRDIVKILMETFSKVCQTTVPVIQKCLFKSVTEKLKL